MKVYTIGFTKKSAKKFFELLSNAGVKRVVDVRLNNVSQLAGFAKKDDLKYFLKTICNIDYVHIPGLAPTQDILDKYKKNKGSWDEYVMSFTGLMKSRSIESSIDKNVIDGGCLLCSEDKPDNCHRRLVVEYLADKWGNLEIQHLK